MKSKILSGTLLCTAVGLLSGCGSKAKDQAKISSSLSLSMQLVGSPSFAPLSSRLPANNFVVDPDEIDFDRAENNPNQIPIEAMRISVVPESYFASIGAISTKSSRQADGGEEVYRCPGATTADCLVELSNPEAVKDLLKNAVLKIEREVDPAEADTRIMTTVQSLSLDACVKGGQKSLVKVKGKAEYFGYTWYTTSNGKVLTTRAEDYDYVTLEEQSCISPPWVLPKTIELKNGDSIKVNLMVNLTDIMQFSLYKGSTGQGGVIQGVKREIYLNYPTPVPYIGEPKEAAVELYRLVSRDTEHGDYYNTDMNATMLMFIDPTSKEPLGASCRIHNDGAILGWSHCPNPESITINGDGTYGLSGSQKVRDSQDEFVALDFTKLFKRENHTGTFETLDYGTAGKRQTWTYTATKL